MKLKPHSLPSISFLGYAMHLHHFGQELRGFSLIVVILVEAFCRWILRKKWKEGFEGETQTLTLVI